MAITVEEYSTLGKAANGSTLNIPNVEGFNGVQAGGDPFHSSTSYVVVTSDADDLIAFGPDGSEGTPNIPVAANVPRSFAVPRGRGWSVVI